MINTPSDFCTEQNKEIQATQIKLTKLIEYRVKNNT